MSHPAGRPYAAGRALLLCTVAITLAGCSLKTMAVKTVANTLSESGDVFSRDEDPELVASYSAAMTEALAWASDNEEAVRAAIATNLEIPEEAAAGITLPTFTWDLADAGIEDLGALAVEFEYIETEPDYGRLIQQQ